MAKRTRIGLIFSYTEEWIAGTYYILNIINALNLLPRDKKPTIVLISDDYSNFDFVKKETNYTFLEFVQTPIQSPKYFLWERSLNKIGSVFGFKKLIAKKPLRANIDFLYPFESENITTHPVKKVNWVPDFQELHLPHLFSTETLSERKKYHLEVICNGDWVVFSSVDSQNDFNCIYPDTSVKQFVLPFSVTHPNFHNQDFKLLLKKYNLPSKFYFAPNQFWAHKNHFVILRAIKELKDQGVSIFVAFSGKEKDHRNADYIHQLKKYISEESLENHISFLGFIPREEQLKMMKQAVAIIQPSKFEGWSTVVEDAKALNQHIILSNLKVHKEQIKENATFFEADDFIKLSTIIKKYWDLPPEKYLVDYEAEKKKFAQNFMVLIDAVTRETVIKNI